MSGKLEWDKADRRSRVHAAMKPSPGPEMFAATEDDDCVLCKFGIQAGQMVMLWKTFPGGFVHVDCAERLA